MDIKDNIDHIYELIDQAAVQYGRKASGIKLMAVSKTRSVAEIQSAIDAGLSLFGENRVEEAERKFAEIDPRKAALVLIGHLQSNKASRIGSRFSAVHSVDSEKIALRLSAVRETIAQPLDILLQINSSGEESKSGFTDRRTLAESASRIAELPWLNIKGLMTMAPFVDDEKTVRSCFALCREWSEDIAPYVDGEMVLSMGMSSDYRWAVAEGSTLLRIGTALFGGRM